MKYILLLSLPLILLSGCNTTNYNLKKLQEQRSLDYYKPVDLIGINYKVADSLVAQLKGKIEHDKPILVATMVNLNNLEETSSLGRITSEQIASRFTQKGYLLIEMKFGDSVYIAKKTGELVLTREVQKLLSEHGAQGVIVGSYTEGKYKVHMNTKLVKKDDLNSVIASYDYEINKNIEVARLLD